jgi:hypothetical protein
MCLPLPPAGLRSTPLTPIVGLWYGQYQYNCSTPFSNKHLIMQGCPLPVPKNPNNSNAVSQETQFMLGTSKCSVIRDVTSSHCGNKSKRTWKDVVPKKHGRDDDHCKQLAVECIPCSVNKRSGNHTYIWMFGCATKDCLHLIWFLQVSSHNGFQMVMQEHKDHCTHKHSE